ncbi:hypothetical protein [Streptomyces sp. N50]|uniref:hypothetical protein n=1 Tax=Streptomyces sp. N50 TaxID=3081765 RepID=UPI002961FE44|nr:hypothetical protein [Streptomyces sp. N50]WOX16823.1 hypothetical protein R2B38_49495 [Streptomyces sp. N50]
MTCPADGPGAAPVLDGDADLPRAAMEPDRRWALVSIDFPRYAICTPFPGHRGSSRPRWLS